jgi:hypothetical protein
LGEEKSISTSQLLGQRQRVAAYIDAAGQRQPGLCARDGEFLAHAARAADDSDGRHVSFPSCRSLPMPFVSSEVETQADVSTSLDTNGKDQGASCNTWCGSPNIRVRSL